MVVKNETMRLLAAGNKNGFLSKDSVNYDCRLCMTEEDVNSFFNGFYDGHLVIAKDLDEKTKIEDCIKDTDEYQDALHGGLQQHLNSIMIAFGHENYKRAEESYYELDIYMENLLQAGSCPVLRNLSFSNDDRHKPILEQGNDEEGWILKSNSGSQVNIISTLDLLSMKNQLFIENKLNAAKAEHYQFSMGQMIGVSNKLMQKHDNELNGSDKTNVIVISVLSIFGAISVIILAVDCKRRCGSKDRVGDDDVQQHEELAQDDS